MCFLGLCKEGFFFLVASSFGRVDLEVEVVIFLGCRSVRIFG